MNGTPKDPPKYGSKTFIGSVWQTHEDYLKVLTKGDFDWVLDSIVRYLGLKGHVTYHLTFIGVSQSVQGFVHHKLNEMDASIYIVIIPLTLKEDANPELITTDSQDGDCIGGLEYQVGNTRMIGDGGLHGTKACNCHKQGGMRLTGTVYIAHIN